MKLPSQPQAIAAGNLGLVVVACLNEVCDNLFSISAVLFFYVLFPRENLFHFCGTSV